jgi:hypothetical protein
MLNPLGGSRWPEGRAGGTKCRVIAPRATCVVTMLPQFAPS